jgi:hypothetical protein
MRSTACPTPAPWKTAALLGVLLAALATAAAAGSPADYRTIDPVALSGHLADVLAVPEAVNPDYWRSKPTLAMPVLPPASLTASKQDLEAVGRMKQGEFTSWAEFPWRPLGVPPPWDTNPFGNLTWDLYRHSLRWTEPLLRAYISKSDLDSLRLMQRVLADWIEKNSVPPGRSQYAWHDQAAGVRLRDMCWFWEVWRKSEVFDPDFARLFLASVYQHAVYLTDPSVYPANFNHGQEMDAALMAAAITFPEFKDASAWYALAEERTGTYLSANFTPDGVHLEQSPFYHWYVLRKAASVYQYLTANGVTPPPAMTEAIRRAAAVMPYLVKPDGLFPQVGDTEGGPGVAQTRYLAQVLGGPVPPAASPAANPRSDGASFFLSFPAGYAIFTAYPVGAPKPSPDTYALFKCNTFPYAHAHYDGLSFLLYGLGRDWIVDSGKLNYEEDTAGRRYMRSSRAHNVVLVDDADFETGPMKLLDWGRTERSDFVTVTHEMRRAHHTRTFEFVPPNTISIRDVLQSADGKPHIYSQLFHVAPGLTVNQASASQVSLVAPDGNICVIDQLTPAGKWKVITGQRDPYYQGWYSSSYNKIEPIPTLYYTSLEPSEQCVFTTRISLVGKEALAALAPPAPSAQPSAKPSLQPPPSGPAVVIFTDPVEQYLSRWKERTETITLRRQDQGLRCDIVGSGDRSAGQYGGVRFPGLRFKALKLELTFLEPQHIKVAYVDGYDDAGKRVMRWEWRMTASNRPKKRATYTLAPGKAAGAFKPVGAANPAAVKELDLFLLIAPGSKTGFILHKVEVTPAG